MVQFEHDLLASRFANDGVPVIPLTKTQLDGCARFTAACSSGELRVVIRACNYCENESFSVLSEKDRYGLPMRVCACRRCGLVQTNPVLDEPSTAVFYRDYYRQIYEPNGPPSDVFFLEQQKKATRIINFLKRVAITGADQMRMLEVGCATGGIVHTFRSAGWHAEGIDLDPAAVEYGRSKHNLELYVGSTRTARLHNSSAFDLIVYADALEHMYDPLTELRTAAELLGSNGRYLFVCVPGLKNLHHSYECDLMHYLQNAHTFHFTLQTLCALAEAAGFKLLHGDEGCWAVFVKSSNIVQGRISEYSDVIRYLRLVNRARIGLRILWSARVRFARFRHRVRR